MTALTHGELFAGISGFGLGFERAGIETVWAVEIDQQAQRVLRHHHPDALIHDDVTTAGAHNLPPVDIITFGSPCQDLSVAGRRQGFDGERSGLYFEAIRVIAELRPALAVWENVPGAFSSNRGHDFGAALDALADIGALDIAWRVLDAQWFGVAQRRRRVFVVADFGGERAGEILALSESGSRDTPPSRTPGQDVAGTLGGSVDRSSSGGGGGLRLDTDRMTFVPLLEVGARTNGDGDRDGDGIGEPGDPMYTLQATKQHGVAMGFDWYVSPSQSMNPSPLSPPLKTTMPPAVMERAAVRRLTPTECERLQGFPDSWTAVDGMSDSARYRMLGNAVCVNVAEWLGKRIAMALEVQE